MAERNEALSLFLELAAIPSPPGEERAVADVVLRYLAGVGLEADEDDTGPSIGSTAGNIYARLEPTAEGAPLFFCAHIDEHDDKDEQHHYPADVDENLHAGDEFSAEKNEKRRDGNQR